MSLVAEKAARAKRLWADDALQEFWKDAQDAQSAVFLDPLSTPEAREEAHAIIRALNRLENRMAVAISDHQHETKKEQKGQHRGSD